MASKLAKHYEKVLSDFEFVLVSQDIAVMAARLRAGTGLRLPDALQAATALEIGAVALVTHDRDFSRLTGLRVILGDGAQFSRSAARAVSARRCSWVRQHLPLGTFIGHGDSAPATVT